MLFRHQPRDGYLIKSLPPRARISDESNTLAEKFAARIEWMKTRGIDAGLAESERPPTISKTPLPGTVIYFSRSS